MQLVQEDSKVFRCAIVDADDAAEVISEYLAGVDREHFVILMVDAKNQVLGVHTVSVGTLMATLVSPREVFKAAILANAASIIAGHNHPSGDTTPSPEDFAVTENLYKAGELLGITLLDHIIVNDHGNFKSMRKCSVWQKALEGNYPTAPEPSF